MCYIHSSMAGDQRLIAYHYWPQITIKGNSGPCMCIRSSAQFTLMVYTRFKCSVILCQMQS